MVDSLEQDCSNSGAKRLIHWGRVKHICVSDLTIIASDNNLSPDRNLAIIWTKAGILLIGLPGTNFSEIFIEIHIFSFENVCERRAFCLGLNVLKNDLVVFNNVLLPLGKYAS